MACLLPKQHVVGQPFTGSKPRRCCTVRHVSSQRPAVQSSTRSSRSAVAACSSRRDALQLGGLLGLIGSGLISADPAQAFFVPPPGYRLHQDKLDGYSFVYPDTWAAVTTSGNDIFLRNPYNVEQNVFVDISSPSSSRYATVTDLGSPEEAAQQLLDQYLNKEFMSTRLGVKREGNVVAAVSREGGDGRLYYDIQIRMASYASRNPYTTTQAQVMSKYGLEWDRQLLTTLGVANNRLYELRLQASSESYTTAPQDFVTILQSFQVKEVEA